MRRTLIVAEMVARDLLRRRGALALLALVPLAFYLARHNDKVGQSIRFASLGLAFAVCTLALFSSTAAKGLEPRLRVGGYRAWELYIGRLTALIGIGLALGTVYWCIIAVDQDLRRPGAVGLMMAMTVVVAAPLGLLIGAIVPRDLEGALLLITLIGLQFLMDPAKQSARLLPLWSNRELGTYAIDVTDAGYLQRGLAHGAGCALLLVGLTATLTSMRLRRRRHMRLSSAA
ncbi:ABC transporter permease [Dactylosporangium sp. NPDC000555]|uniref:ABC transporter permease n=1 Tax=Dactylosporangium sp. NPDC000555 TaxID=3154260 RepID=UPI003333A2EF